MISSLLYYRLINDGRRCNKVSPHYLFKYYIISKTTYIHRGSGSHPCKSPSKLQQNSLHEDKTSFSPVSRWVKGGGMCYSRRVYCSLQRRASRESSQLFEASIRTAQSRASSIQPDHEMQNSMFDYFFSHWWGWQCPVKLLIRKSYSMYKNASQFDFKWFNAG